MLIDNRAKYRLVVDGRIEGGPALTIEQARAFKIKNASLDVAYLSEKAIPAYARAHGIDLDELD